MSKKDLSEIANLYMEGYNNSVTFSKDEIADYLLGWLDAGMGDNQDINSIYAALKNATSMLGDDQDGIEAVRERKKYYDT